MAREITIAHAINPVKAPAGSALGQVQPVTFASMLAAQRFAQGQVDVRFVSAQYAEDREVIPAAFTTTPDLTRSAADIGRFRETRKLPLIADILDRAYEATEASYLIYTNVDIALMPHFYLAVTAYIKNGYDAFVVNRRTISDRYQGIDDIPLMYAELGRPHPGWDCFVFPRDQFPDYRLGSVLVGVPRVGLALIANLVAHADNFREFRDQHLTFHLGDDRPWGGERFADYAEHNTREALSILETLEREKGAFTRSTPPGSFLFKQRTLAPVYERWVRFIHGPSRVARFLRKRGTK